jgi:cytochrome c553
MKMITLAILLAAMQANQPDNRGQVPDFANTPSPNTVHIDAPRDTWTELSLMLDGALNEPQADDRRLRRKLSACERCHSTDLSASNTYLPELQKRPQRLSSDAGDQPVTDAGGYSVYQRLLC